MPYTKILMSVTALVLLAAGIALSFAPQETAAALGLPAEPATTVLFKLMGGLYLGFAMMDWTARSNMIGGIYARPIAIGNFLHFFVGALVLSKHQIGEGMDPILLGALIGYLVFAIAFGWLMFGKGAACVTASD